MADPKKYKVKIVKIGLGDPVLALAYQFVSASDAGSGYTDPTIHPISEIDIHISVYGGANEGGVGHININTISTLDQDVLMMPFDDSDYQSGVSYTAQFNFDDGSNEFHFDDPSDGYCPSDWIYVHVGNTFEVVMTSGFNDNGLQVALQDALWIPS